MAQAISISPAAEEVGGAEGRTSKPIFREQRSNRGRPVGSEEASQKPKEKNKEDQGHRQKGHPKKLEQTAAEVNSTAFLASELEETSVTWLLL